MEKLVALLTLLGINSEEIAQLEAGTIVPNDVYQKIIAKQTEVFKNNPELKIQMKAEATQEARTGFLKIIEKQFKEEWKSLSSEELKTMKEHEVVAEVVKKREETLKTNYSKLTNDTAQERIDLLEKANLSFQKKVEDYENVIIPRVREEEREEVRMFKLRQNLVKNVLSSMKLRADPDLFIEPILQVAKARGFVIQENELGEVVLLNKDGVHKALTPDGANVYELKTFAEEVVKAKNGLDVSGVVNPPYSPSTLKTGAIPDPKAGVHNGSVPKNVAKAEAHLAQITAAQNVAQS